ncbi:protein singed [Pseudomonas sp.]|uniref:protein singed n=1 Tax=Pseudomonas sp. TaxID=306 RepID=UPI002589C1CB|nr:protein singed [Pseudomonas sp.]
MATYITTADVDAILGAAWAADESKASAVLQANAYLTAMNLTGIDTQAMPDEALQAGAQLAKCAAAGRLYQQRTEGALESKSVKAGPVSSSKTYGAVDQNSAAAQPAEVQLALALLAAWRSNPFAFTVCRG